jgi:uncharacterized protein YecE (DUF72 family)
LCGASQWARKIPKTEGVLPVPVEFRVGSASWTDPTLTNSDLFYPPSVRSAEERLRFYAEQFNTVEVDSTYYALPAERNAKVWTERTPDGFVFNIKPFALITQHPAEMSRLPNQLREMVPAAERGDRQLTRPSKEVVDMAFQMFWSAIALLRESGKLGMVGLPVPAVFHSKACQPRLPREPSRTATGASIAIEFRHPSWVRDKARRNESMNFLRSHGLYYASIDASEDNSIVPSFIEATGDQVYVRFHGKNRENWFKRNITAAERFKYLYSERELQSLGTPRSHAFVERLIGTVRREYLDRTLFWNQSDLERKLENYKTYYNLLRCHSGLAGATPAERSGMPPPPIAKLDSYSWRQHCNGLFQTPNAA